MKQILLFLCFYVSVYAGVVNLSKEQANEMIEQRAKFFTQVFLVPYDTQKLSLDSDKKLSFIDLCKYPAKGYEFPCGEVYGEVNGIRKYFIKAKNIEEAYKIFEPKEQKLQRNVNIYDYGEEESNKDDEVGSYYIWDNVGRFWIINIGYDSGSITIFTQKNDMVEVIDQWNMHW